MMAQLAKPVLTVQYLPTAPHFLRRGSGTSLTLMGVVAVGVLAALDSNNVPAHATTERPE
jgi:hypothetical protein